MRRLGLMLLLTATLHVVASAQETTGTITGVTERPDRRGAAGRLGDDQEHQYRHVRAPWSPTRPASTRPRCCRSAPTKSPSSSQGFRPVTLKNIDLHVNDRLKLDGHLSVGGVAESVEVTAGQSLVQPIAALQSTMTSTQVKELPLNNRNFVQLATLAPGVSSDLADEVGVGLTSTVSMSINGARRNAVNWLVDGVSNVDVGSNITLLSTPSLESIEEFKIITNGYQAEWPRSGGGVVNVVTKSGDVALRRQRLRVPAHRQVQRELVLPQPERRSGDQQHARPS